MQCGPVSMYVGHPDACGLGTSVGKRLGQCLNGDVVNKGVCRFRYVLHAEEPQSNPSRCVAGECDVVVLPGPEAGGNACGHRHECRGIGGVGQYAHLHPRGRVGAVGVAHHLKAQQQAVGLHVEFGQHHQQLRSMQAVARQRPHTRAVTHGGGYGIGVGLAVYCFPTFGNGGSDVLERFAPRQLHRSAQGVECCCEGQMSGVVGAVLPHADGIVGCGVEGGKRQGSASKGCRASGPATCEGHSVGDPGGVVIVHHDVGRGRGNMGYFYSLRRVACRDAVNRYVVNLYPTSCHRRCHTGAEGDMSRIAGIVGENHLHILPHIRRHHRIECRHRRESQRICGVGHHTHLHVGYTVAVAHPEGEVHAPYSLHFGQYGKLRGAVVLWTKTEYLVAISVALHAQHVLAAVGKEGPAPYAVEVTHGGIILEILHKRKVERCDYIAQGGKRPLYGDASAVRVAHGPHPENIVRGLAECVEN